MATNVHAANGDTCNGCRYHLSALPSNYYFIHKTPFQQENKKQVAGTKHIQTLKYALILAQGEEVKLKNLQGSK